jgi:hypothetical protein
VLLFSKLVSRANSYAVLIELEERRFGFVL